MGLTAVDIKMGEPIAEMEFGLSNNETLDALKPDIKKNDEEREADLLKSTSDKSRDFSAPENVEENIFGNTSKESNAQQINEPKTIHTSSKNDEISTLDVSEKLFPPVKQIAEIDFGASSTHALETLEEMQKDLKKRNEEAEKDPKVAAIHHIRDEMPKNNEQ